MKICTMPSKDVASYVNDILQNSNSDWLSIMIMSPIKSGDSSARTVIATESEDIAENMRDYLTGSSSI